MKKTELRQIFLARRKALGPDALQEKSRRINGRFFANFDLSKVRSLHVFISIEKFHEVDTSLIIGEVWTRFPRIKVVAPRIDQQKGEIESVPYRSDTKLTENGWGIREPAGPALTDAHAIDLVLVPLICFDDFGHRVGYGKGYYDNFLKKCRPACQTVGLSFFHPVERIDDIREDDVPLDVFITPEKIHYGKAKAPMSE